ncbi:hypothetical protein OUZ56_009835 [Daphnia magna]|uniref:Uncharacterized protein n=1 Tax=Daphnia magna TaxID=35525 RepID=A0ABR0AH73_9CRUS|nr:hypothetical protein OUZ56_009835 [Daphnia magna]
MSGLTNDNTKNLNSIPKNSSNVNGPSKSSGPSYSVKKRVSTYSWNEETIQLRIQSVSQYPVLFDITRADYKDVTVHARANDSIAKGLTNNCRTGLHSSMPKSELDKDDEEDCDKSDDEFVENVHENENSESKNDAEKEIEKENKNYENTESVERKKVIRFVKHQKQEEYWIHECSIRLTPKILVVDISINTLVDHNKTSSETSSTKKSTQKSKKGKNTIQDLDSQIAFLGDSMKSLYGKQA